MKKLSLLKIPRSETVAINTLALEKIAAGEKIFNLAVGEPVMPILSVVKRAVLRCLKLNQTRYPQAGGLPELRIAAARWINRSYGADFQKENTLIVNGGKFGLFLLLQAMLKPRDQVLIPAPYWVSYPSMVKLFGGQPKIIQTTLQSGWKITAKDLEKNSTSRTKILILNSGSNPTGALYTVSELEAILKVAQRKNLFVISDEVYSGLVYDGRKYVSCVRFKKYRNRMAIIQSCSKNFAMPGLRVGFVFATPQIIEVLIGLITQSTSGVDTLSQWAALAALSNAKQIIPKIRDEMQKRRDIFIQEFSRQFGIKLDVPHSALYAFVHLSSLGCKHSNSAEFCRTAMQKTNVALVPGSAFGQEGYVRFSFGERPEIIKGAIKNLAKYVKA